MGTFHTNIAIIGAIMYEGKYRQWNSNTENLEMRVGDESLK